METIIENGTWVRIVAIDDMGLNGRENPPLPGDLGKEGVIVGNRVEVTDADGCYVGAEEDCQAGSEVDTELNVVVYRVKVEGRTLQVASYEMEVV